MFKAIWMSDPHFTCEGKVLGHDPRSRLTAAISYTNEHHGDANVCVLSGDLVDRGTIADYNALSSSLSNLNIPFLPMVGNHDDRALFRSSLPLPETCMENFIQYSIEVEDFLIVCLDTKKTGSDGGEFCSERRAWLQNILEYAKNSSVYIFMHHPPLALGLPMQDSECMEDGDDFLALLSEHKCVKYLFFGHVHRPVAGAVKGIPFATMRSILYQAPAPQPAWGWDTFIPSVEAPNLGVISLTESTVNLQYLQFCDYDSGVTNSHMQADRAR